MLTGKQKNDWIHTTHVLTTLWNIHRKEGTKPITFEDVYPYAPKRSEIAEARALWMSISGAQGEA